MARKPIAVIRVLACGPGAVIRLPSEDRTRTLAPPCVVKVYSADDLEVIKKVFPLKQLKIREFANEPIVIESVRARDEKGQFVADDPNTPEVDEAYDPPKPVKKRGK